MKDLNLQNVIRVLPEKLNLEFFGQQISTGELNKHYLMISKLPDRFRDYVEFGTCGDSKSIHYIVINFKQDLRLYFSSEEQSISSLLNYFLRIVNTPEKNQNLIPYFRNKLTQQIIPVDSPISKHINLFNKSLIEVQWSKQLINIQQYNQKFKPIQKKNSKQLGLVTFQIFVKITGKKFLSLDVSPIDTIKDIKQQIFTTEKIPLEQQLLVFCGKRLKDDCNLSNYDIKKQSTLYLVLKLNGGCFKASAKISMSNGTLKDIQTLKEEDQITSYNTLTKMFETDVITNVHSVFVKQYIVIHLQNGDFIQCTPNHQFLCVGNIWKKYQIDQVYCKEQSLDVGCLLIHQSAQCLRVCSIEYKVLTYPQNFYHICTQRNHNFITNGVVAHNMKIFIKSLLERVFQLDVQPQDTIADIKRQIQAKEGIPPAQQKLFKSGLELLENKSLCDYNIQKDSTLCLFIRIKTGIQIHVQLIPGKFITFQIEPMDTIMHLKEKIEYQEEIPVYIQTLIYGNIRLEDSKTFSYYNIQRQTKLLLILDSEREKFIKYKDLQLNQKRLILTVSNSEQYFCPYGAVKNVTFQQLIKIILKNSSKFFSLLYQDKFLLPEIMVSSLQLQFERFQEINLIVVKVEKLLFYKSMQEARKIESLDLQLRREEQKIIQKREMQIINSQINQNYKKKAFYQPILLYTCSSIYSQLNQYLTKLYTEDQVKLASHWEFVFASFLVSSLAQLNNFVGLVHRGMRHFRFSSLKLKRGDVFNWRSFTSTSCDPEVAHQFKSQNGTIFHINSLTGKDVNLFSAYSYEKEILLLPFTYFMVDHIIEAKDYDEAWLTQMPTPVTFSKKILLWVDDRPTNNLDIMGTISQQSDVQILPLTSTKMADQWMKIFNWVLVWTGVSFKVISDMVRHEPRGVNFYAGIDLLQLFYNRYGYTIPVLICCKAVQKGKHNTNQRKIKKESLYKITNDRQEVLSYALK